MKNRIFSSTNILYLLIGLLLLVAGYVLLGQGPVNNPLSKTVAPLVLIAVYCIVIPFAILTKGKKDSTEEQNKQ